jgi:hypothetical protein
VCAGEAIRPSPAAADTPAVEQGPDRDSDLDQACALLFGMRVRPPDESTPDAGEAAAPANVRRRERAAGLARGLLWAFVAALALQLGGGLYEHTAIVSRWCFAPGPIVSDALASSGQVHAALHFWPFVSPLAVALALANGVAAFRARGRARGWWFGAALLEVFVAALTYAYFVPELDALQRGAVLPAEVESRALAWASLNGARLALEACAFVFALAAFSRYGSVAIVETEPPS